MQHRYVITFLVIPVLLLEASYPEWRSREFDAVDRLNDTISGPLADPDGDNLPNVYEYASGTDPRTANRLITTLRPHADWIKGDFEELAVNLPANANASQAAYSASITSRLDGSGQWESLTGTESATVIESDGSIRRQILLPAESLDLDSTVSQFLQATVSLNAPDYVWIEAEDNTAISSHYTEHHELLSNREWVYLNNASERFIEWDNIQIPADGDYKLYVRKFWKHGPFHWSMNGSGLPGPSGQVTRDISLLDAAELYTNHVVNWVYVDTVNLQAGAHSLRIQQDETDGAAAYDCILFIRGSFEARGKLKPEERYAATAEDGWFDFQPDPDRFNPTPVDLRHLNEPHAGSRGWITADGPHFRYPDNGETLRLWGINMGPGQYVLPHDRIDALARFYAKRGINHVRLHGALYNGSGTDMEVIKPELLDGVHYLVKALKDQGIYTTLSIYFPLWVDIHPDDARFPGYNNSHPFALPYFNTAFQDIYRGWWETILTSSNPYTGIPLKDDPALLSCELVNEDSTLFWTFSLANIPDPQMQLLEKQFGDWCIAEYGGITQTLTIWNENHSRDNASAGRLGFVGLWAMANDPATRRDKDSARFLTEIMRAFYDTNMEYLKQTLGYKGLVTGTNWKTASAVVLDPLEKWANAGVDYLDNHGYYGPQHYGTASSYSVRANTAYQDRAAVRFDDAKDRSIKNFSNPVMATNYAGKPTTISEINWPEPNAWRADAIPFIAAYAALQGIDAINLFTTTAVDWDATPSTKFPMQTPVTMIQWPGAALMYRLGMIREGNPAVVIQLNEDDLWNLEGTPLPQPQNLDSLRDPGVGSGSVTAGALAYLVGPVNSGFVQSPTPSSMTDNTPGHVDLVNRKVSSITGEIHLDWGNGVLTINSPRAQGVSGFLSSISHHEMDAVSINSNMSYGSILAVAMDDRPLLSSNSILLQAVSEDRPNGFMTRPVQSGDTAIHEDVTTLSDGSVITDVGAAPMMVRQLHGSISLNRPDASELSVFSCDANGNMIERVGNAGNFDLKPEVFYYFIHNPGP